MAQEKLTKPNILFLFSDDQRFDTIAALGNTEVKTPNLDRLVRRGTSFTHAAIMGGTQGAVCIPSRAMLLTGKTLFRAEPALKNGAMLMPQWFQKHGYVSYISGKWHNNKNQLRGFDNGAVYFGGMGKANATNDGTTVPVQEYDGEKWSELREVQDATQFFTDKALQFLDEHEEKHKDKPFFAYVPFTTPHDPRLAPKKWHDLYDPAKITLPPNFLAQHPFDNGELQVRDELLAAFPRMPDEIRRHIADYYASISWLDFHVGRLLDALEKSGQLQNTIIVFAGDNGLAVGQHGLMGKQNVYEHSVRVPLIIAGPGVPQNQRNEAFCYLLDLFPTLCDLSGLPLPEGLEGRSLAPLLRGENMPGRGDLFFAYRDLQRSVRIRGLKLIENYGPDRVTQLFNLDVDPWETHNLAGEPAYAETLKILRFRLTEWQKQVEDPRLKQR